MYSSRKVIGCDNVRRALIRLTAGLLSAVLSPGHAATYSSTHSVSIRGLSIGSLTTRATIYSTDFTREFPGVRSRKARFSGSIVCHPPVARLGSRLYF